MYSRLITITTKLGLSYTYINQSLLMRKKILITTLLLTFFGCSSPSIKREGNETLRIEIDSKTVVEASGEIIYKSRVNLSNINIYQYVYKMKSGRYLTYEDASVATGYKFYYGINRTIDIIFPKYQTEILNSNGNLYFVKLTNTDNSAVYLILENINKKRLKFLYGFDKNELQSIYNSLHLQSKVESINSKVTDKKNDSAPEDFIISNWSYKNIILDGLLMKYGSRGYH